MNKMFLKKTISPAINSIRNKYISDSKEKKLHKNFEQNTQLHDLRFCTLGCAAFPSPNERKAYVINSQSPTIGEVLIPRFEKF